MAISSSNVGFGVGSGGGGGELPVDTIPFRLLAVGDFSREGRGFGDEAPAQVYRVDKDSFDDLFGKLKPRLLFEVKNALAAGGGDITVDLEIGGMKDFEGPAIAAKVPALASLLQLKDEIAKGAESLSAAELADKIHAATGGDKFGQDLIQAVRASGGGAAPAAKADSGSTPKADAGGGSLMDMVDFGEESTAAAQERETKKAMSSVISSIAKTSKPVSQSAKTALGAMETWFAERLGKQLDLILHHPDFQSMESSWRGLRFLVSRTDFRKPIVIEVLAAQKKDLRKFLSEVLTEEYQSPGEIPLGAVICDSGVDTTQPDLELIQELAVKGELAQAPVVIQAAPEFFGRKTLHGLGASGSLNELLAGAQFTKWKGLRDKDEARWAAVAMNRMLLREPYKHVPGKSYPETVEEGKGAGLLWGSAVWALGACMTQSFAQQGWAHFISGLRQGGAVENLPLRQYEVRAGKTVQTPLEANLTEMNTGDLAAAGLIPMAANEGTDTAFFTYTPCVAAPKRYSTPAATQEAAMHAILPYQLFAGRMSAILTRLISRASGGGSAEQVQAFLESQLRSALTRPGEKPEASTLRVEVSEDDKNPARYEACFDIRPSFKFFNLTPRLLLTVGVAK